MKPVQVKETLNDLLGYMGAEQARLAGIDDWLNCRNYAADFIRMEEKSSPEKRALRSFAQTPLLRLVVEATAQQMVLNGVSVGEGRDGDKIFAPWVYNGMPSRELALWEAALGYGYAYVMVLPAAANSPLCKDSRAWMRPYSPRDLYAFYPDAADDDWPMFALRTIRQKGSVLYRLYDEENVYFLGREKSGETVFIESRAHGLGVCPVIRFTSSRDLQGRMLGEVDKNRDVVRRYTKTVYDRMLIQHHNSWRIITATGLEDLGSDEDAEKTRTRIAHDTVLLGEGNVQFGSLPETQLQGILQSVESDIQTLAAVSQTPLWTFNGGQLVNLSADALEEAQSVHRNKVEQKKKEMGCSVAEVLRLAATVEGRTDDARDYTIKAQWEDVQARSMSQAADALGKMTQMLGIPAELLWDRIPGVTPAEAREWADYAKANPSGEDRLADLYSRQLGGGDGRDS